ncbi:hypothetical protein HII36_36405 [Nonomuraea sp. NN258]|uniref:hypothetical protein n=1 Tax=Nonomuraea antri TaxID=2730852 RepID=UPI001567CBE2|nr:hypothetical protein [Nonomuraea antri]NRQ37281.1 hypothetical protein [Nonomuraea antri]
MAEHRQVWGPKARKSLLGRLIALVASWIGGALGIRRRARRHPDRMSQIGEEGHL